MRRHSSFFVREGGAGVGVIDFESAVERLHRRRKINNEMPNQGFPIVTCNFHSLAISLCRL
jgi:hypothetical protein